MKIFISWSGEKSRRVAEALCVLIKKVMRTTDPWMSPQISAGSWWSEILHKKLAEAHFGIICITKDNVNAPWIHFEAGALAKTVDKGMDLPVCCPYLIDLDSSQLPETPLSSLQWKRANESETWELIQTISEQLEEDIKLPDEQLQVLFKHYWNDLKKTLDDLPKGETEPPRKPDQMIEEILGTVRDLSRRSPYERALRPDDVLEIIRTLLESGVSPSSLEREFAATMARLSATDFPSIMGMIRQARDGLGDF